MNYVELFDKYRSLTDTIKRHSKVAVAFSGGVDSTFLLYVASKYLDKNHLSALHGISLLNSERSNSVKFCEKFLGDKVTFDSFELNPLNWEYFCKNSPLRCYNCKKKIYSEFLKGKNRDAVLMDGTNFDDLKEDRPGLKAIKELGILTPLADAKLKKSEIRFLLRYFGLAQCDIISESCYATRIPVNSKIDKKSIEKIVAIEDELARRGCLGMRVRPSDEKLILELRQQDFEKFNKIHNRTEVLKFCSKHGFKKVFLDIKGRN